MAVDRGKDGVDIAGSVVVVQRDPQRAVARRAKNALTGQRLDEPRRVGRSNHDEGTPVGRLLRGEEGEPPLARAVDEPSDERLDMRLDDVETHAGEQLQ